MSRSPRRPRRARALVLAVALSASMFATALPAAAKAPTDSGGGQVTTMGWMWVR
jgi:hypothetical protein